MKTNSEVAQQKDTADPQMAQKILAITLAFNEADWKKRRSCHRSALYGRRGFL